ncbi:MATE family efflux transporter [bacterium SCSIO 12696]|nr:MATE family efflux transporter [bacterium SCSIO 12696]
MAVPMAIGMFFNTAYSVVDTFYAGLISTDAQASLSIASQVFFLLIAVGFGLSSAMAALIGNAYGEGDTERARQIAQKGLLFGALVSFLLTLVGLYLAPELIKLISTEGPYRTGANHYLNWLLLGVIFFLLAFIGNGILQARGDTRSMQRAHIVAFFANLALNPLFIFGIPGLFPAFGFNGLALSTLLSQSGVMFYILFRVFKTGTFANASLASFLRMEWQIYRDILAQAIPSTFTMMLMILSGFVIQFFLKDFGSQAVAGYGVAMRIEQLVLLPVFGLTGSLMPLAAQNYGAKNYQRVREAAFFCFRFGCTMMLLSGAFLWFLGGVVLTFFTSNPEVVRIGASYLKVTGLIHWAYLIMFAINSLLQAFKKPAWSLLIGIYRQGIGIALFSYIYLAIFDFGVIGIWLGIATSVLTGMLLSVVIIRRLARQLGVLAA